MISAQGQGLLAIREPSSESSASRESGSPSPRPNGNPLEWEPAGLGDGPSAQVQATAAV